MGCGEKNSRAKCKTCDKNFDDCPGHFGYISLTKPIFHIFFIKECQKLLECICKNCSRVLLSNKEKHKISKKKIKN